MNKLQNIINSENNLQRLDDEHLDLLRLELSNAVALVTSIDTSQSRFCIDKSTLAAETASFYLKQRQNIFNSGFPSAQLPYLTLVTQKLTQLNNVFIELYKIDVGYIYFLKDSYPDVALWALLSIGLEKIDNRSSFFAISIADALSEASWKSIASLSDSEGFCAASRILIQSSSIRSSLLFDTLQLRGELSSKFAMTLLSLDCTIDEEIMHRYLVTQNLPSSCDWMVKQPVTPGNVFEHLLSRPDRREWFRTQCYPNVTVDELAIFGDILGISEYTHSAFEPSCPIATVRFALKGDSRDVNQVIAMLSEINEDTGESWIVALYVIFGTQLPVLPSQIGTDIDYSVAVKEIQTWWGERSEIVFSFWRSGDLQNFDNSLNLLASVEVTANFRMWIWKELCVICRGYFPWNSLVKAERQYSVLSKMRSNCVAKERYNVREKNAVVGY